MASLDALAGIDKNLLLRANALTAVLRNKVASEIGIEGIPTISFVEDRDTKKSILDNGRAQGGNFPVVTVTENRLFGGSLTKLKIHPSSIIERAKHISQEFADIPIERLNAVLLLAACQMTLQSLYLATLGSYPSDAEIADLESFVVENE